MNYIWNMITFPVRMLLPQSWLPFAGMEPICEDRYREIMPLLRGRVLDVGCGPNIIVQRWGPGVGCDIDGAIDGRHVTIQQDGKLPFAENTFDTVILVASLHHAIERIRLLRECHRVLKPGGQIALTSMTRRTGTMCHWLVRHWDHDQRIRTMHESEVFGIDDHEIYAMLTYSDFVKVRMKQFGFLGLNHLFVAERL